MTNYELLRWLTETWSRDREHNWMLQAKTDRVTFHYVHGHVIAQSSTTGQARAAQLVRPSHVVKQETDLNRFDFLLIITGFTVISFLWDKFR